MYAIFAITRFTLLEVLRNRLIWLFIVLLLIGVMLAEFFAGVAITESLAIKTSLLSALLRIFAVFVISLFVITSMVREISDKGLELSLSLPVSRTSYYLGKFLAYSVVAIFMSIIVAITLLFYAPAPQILIWSCSLICELLIISAFSLLCVFTFNQVTTAITAVAGFYVLARSIHALQLMGGSSLVDPSAYTQIFISKSVNGLAYMLPDLYRFNPSEWLIYPDTSVGQLLPIAGQTLVYLFLLIAAGLFDFSRKNL